MIHCGLFLLLLLVCYTKTVAEDTWHVSSSTPLPRNQFQITTWQGLCTDGDNFIMSSDDQIYLTTTDNFDVIKSNLDAIPHNLRHQGFHHLGDGDYSKGLLYYGVEAYDFVATAIFVYNITDTSIEFFNYKIFTDIFHLPWVAIDPVSDMLFASDYFNVTELRIYDKNTLEFSHIVELDMMLTEIQGGAFYKADGMLYLGCNAGDSVFSVNTATGHVLQVMAQHEPESEEEYEIEGLTFLDLRSQGLGLMHNNGNYQETLSLVHSEPN